MTADFIRRGVSRATELRVEPYAGQLRLLGGDERWIITDFQHRAYAVADADPSKYLEKVKLDGVTAYQCASDRPRRS